MRTRKEVNSQIRELRRIVKLPTFRRRTLFGDDNVAGIKAQIEVLKEGLSDNDIDYLQDNETYSEHTACIARDAAAWLYNNTEQTPAAGWKGLF